MTESYILSDKNNLRVKVFVVGYPSCGESVVACICDEDTVIYTCVIDSFKYKGNNETMHILERLGVSTINLLCWSHPDHDHTFDMESIITQFCDDKTIFLLPLGLHGKPYDNVNYNKGDLKIVNRIAQLNAKEKMCHNTVCVNPQRRQEIDGFSLSCYPDEIEVTINALSPPSPLINHRIAQNQLISKNEFCITLCISVGAYRFLLCSDIENPVIDCLHSGSLYKPVLVKIPHHGSPTADAFLNRAELSSDSTFACTTGYRSHGLPNNAILQAYGEQCQMVHFTGAADTHKYGVVEYTFTPYAFLEVGEEMVRACSKMKIDCRGNAVKVFPMC